MSKFDDILKNSFKSDVALKHEFTRYQSREIIERDQQQGPRGEKKNAERKRSVYIDIQLKNRSHCAKIHGAHCHSPLPDWIADAGELALGVDMGAPQDSRKGILAINSNSN